MAHFKEIVIKGWNRFQNTTTFKIIRFITNSAAVALLITAVIFVYQEYEEQKRTDKIVDELQGISRDMLEVQRGISTRYLGIFPDYIEVANSVIESVSPGDSIIIFEDVLYYGFLSRPKEFIEMNQVLLSHAKNGDPVTVVYYDEDARVFHRMIREEFISPVYFSKMNQSMRTSAGGRNAIDSY